MKFRNDTEETKKVRTGDIKGYIWHSVKPGEIIDIDLGYGIILGFTPAEEDKKIEESKIKAIPKSNNKYKEFLMSINGIGEKTADDIISIYSSIKELKKAIKSKAQLPLRDDVEKNLKKTIKCQK